MQAPKTHPILPNQSLPPSPHKESYGRFYGSLRDRIKKWLTDLLIQLKEEKKIAFDPAVDINANVDTQSSLSHDNICIFQGRE